jgi:hypothetical protein
MEHGLRHKDFQLYTWGFERGIKDFLRHGKRFVPNRNLKKQATKYGNGGRFKPQLVVAKNRNYTAWVSHNFFYNFSPFLLTCHESRL